MDDVVAKVNTPTKENHTFEGWYSDSALTTLFDFDTPIVSALTLYVKWQEVETEVKTYTVSFDSKGGSVIQPVTVDEGALIEKPSDPTKENHTFERWYSDSELNTLFDFSTPIMSDLILYAKWEVNTHTLTLVVDGLEMLVNYRYQQPIEPIANPEKEGYTFIGWQPQIPAVMPVENMVIVAQFEIKSYEIGFDLDGGFPNYNTVSVNHNETLTKPANPDKVGHTFAGWFLNNTLYDFTTPVTSSFTLKAHWTETMLLITLNLNGGVGEESVWVPYGQEGRLLDIPNPTKPGYLFAGWMREGLFLSMFSNNIFTSITITTSMEIEAIWLPIDHQIEFNYMYEKGK